MEINTRIKEIIKSAPIMVFMKGNKLWPACGFSGKVVDLLNHYEIEYETFDILNDEEIRQGIKEYSKWPTFPQVYIKGELIGGCDILLQLHEQNELLPILENAK